MPTTAHELNEFHRFALDRIGDGGERLSLAELVDLWELEHPTSSEQSEIDAALNRATAELEAGAGRPAEVFNQELRNQYGFAER